MRKVIATINDDGSLKDDNGIFVVNTTGMNLIFTDYPDELVLEHADIDVVKLVGLGVSPDDLIKMKASGVI